VAMHFLGTLRPSDPASPTITLNNMWLEIDASRERVTGDPDSKYLQGARWLSFLAQRLPELTFTATDEELQRYKQTGLKIIEWQWNRMVDSNRGSSGNSKTLRNTIVTELPRALIESAKKYSGAWPASSELLD